MNKLKAFASLGVFALIAAFSPLSVNAQGKDKEILVEWANTVQVTQSDSALKAAGGRRVGTFRTPLMRQKGRGYIERISIPDDANPGSVIETYKKLPGVKTVEINLKYQAVDLSNDTYYSDGSLWGMYSDDSPAVVGPSGTTNAYGSQAEQAWNSGYIGNTKTVVGVIDTGVDYTHPDLYLNIYLNQGEIKPLAFFNSLTDVDGDGLITFRDLNNPANSAYVSDLNSNGRIDAGDLLADSRWANGVDNDSNGFVDDLIGWDFDNGDNDPMDDNYHGTHVSGTIGGLGGNSLGVAGVNWKVQIMPLKFLNSGGSGYLSDAVQAIDYFTSATQAQDKVYNQSSPLVFIGTNNSWGGGGYSSLLKTSIDNGALVNNHFVAAAGNSGSNNDTGPFYPSNYSTLSVAGWEAVTAVASISSNGALSWFSCFGATTVDIGAPGDGVQSTFPDNSYDSISGTSMATPHVMGSLALFASSFPQAGRRELREVLLSTVRSTTSLSGKVVTNGRLDVRAGLSELLSRYPLNGPTYSIAGPSSVDEGVSVSLPITTANVNNGTVLYWSISGVQSADLNPSALPGTVTISNNSGSVSFSTVNDNAFEGTETLQFRLFTDSNRTQQVASKSVTINDTSNGVTYFWGTTGNDTIGGTAGRDYMTGIPSTGTTAQQLGKGQIDTITGKGGPDTFYLGIVRDNVPRVLYNNGVASATGAGDYLLITDFNKLIDKIQLVNGRYFSRNATTNTVIYWDRNNNGTLNLTGTSRDEVIAILRNVNLGNLTITTNSFPSWVTFVN